MGEILKGVYELQLDGIVRDLDDAITEARKLLPPTSRSTPLPM
jgi:hypothetical protein